MILKSPYKNAGHWYRGSLHIHSAFSACGWHSMEELALVYRDFAYVAITDHDRVTVQTEAFANKIVFRGVEVSGDHHMLLIGITPPAQAPIKSAFSTTHYGSLAARAIQAGGLAIASHPMREFGQHWSEEELMNTPNLTGMEIFSGDGIHVDQDVGFRLWDNLLSRGKQLWGFGNDDFHHWGQERRVWNVANAAAKTPADILTALRQGDFYVSTGFGFEHIDTERETVTFHLLKDTPQYRDAYKYITLYGKNGRVLSEQTGRFTQFAYTAKGDEGYIRAEAYMNGGYAAFSQPIYVCEDM